MVQSEQQLFRSLFPEGLGQGPETVLLRTGAALQQTFLLHGVLFFTEAGLHFHSRSWLLRSDSVSVPYSAITAVEKRDAALFIPNALEIFTSLPDRDSLFFASLEDREAVFALLTTLRDNQAAVVPIPVAELESNQAELLEPLSTWATSRWRELAAPPFVSIDPPSPEPTPPFDLSLSPKRSLPVLPDEAPPTSPARSPTAASSRGPPGAVPEFQGPPSDGERSPPGESPPAAPGDEFDAPFTEPSPAAVASFLSPDEIEHIQDMTVNVSPVVLFRYLLYSDFLEQFHLERGDSDIRNSEFEDSDRGGKSRLCTYETTVTVVTSSRKPVTEYQRYLRVAPSHYILEMETHTAGVPYADSWHLLNYWHFKGINGDTQTVISTYTKAQFTGRVLVRRMIENGAKTEVTASFGTAFKLLQSKIDSGVVASFNVASALKARAEAPKRPRPAVSSVANLGGMAGPGGPRGFSSGSASGGLLPIGLVLLLAGGVFGFFYLSTQVYMLSASLASLQAEQSLIQTSLMDWNLDAACELAAGPACPPSIPCSGDYFWERHLRLNADLDAWAATLQSLQASAIRLEKRHSHLAGALALTEDHLSLMLASLAATRDQQASLDQALADVSTGTEALAGVVGALACRLQGEAAPEICSRSYRSISPSLADSDAFRALIPSLDILLGAALPQRMPPASVWSRITYYLSPEYLAGGNSLGRIASLTGVLVVAALIPLVLLSR